MHTAVMTCDFLLAPASCAPDELESRVSDLAEYARSTKQHGQRPLLEPDATEKLIDSGKYPCDGLFKNNISKLDEPIFTVKDISRIVTGILSNSDYFSYSEKRLWESDELEFTPPFTGLPPTPIREIFRLVEEVAVFNELESYDYSLLHFCTVNTFCDITLSAKLKEIFPPGSTILPLSLSKKIKLQSNYRQYLKNVSLGTLISNKTENPELIKDFFYSESLRALEKRNLPLENLSYDSFYLGPKFIESLKLNQCLPGQNFWGVCSASVVAIITNDSEFPVNIFKRSSKIEEQQTHGEFKAYRCHVTKGHVGLRLMFWRDSQDRIVLANVGPKHEEEIEDPE